MDSKDFCDILTEAVEVFLNHILYIRNIYPDQIFKKRRAFNTPIYVSIFPPLNEYFRKILRAVRELIPNKELLLLELAFYRHGSVICEKYNFQFRNVESSEPNADVEDNFLLNFEEQLRTALYTLAERVKPLEKLQQHTKFKVLLHTTQAAFVRLTNNPNHQESLRSESGKEEIALLPMTSISSVGIEITTEVF